MKIIIWDLPEKQITYLKENCQKQFSMGRICVMEPGTVGKIYSQMSSGEWKAKELLIISKNAQILTDAILEGIATIAYQKPGTFADTDKALPAVDMVVEGFEEVDYNFLKRVYQRHHRIPWTIFETERFIVRELDLSDMDALFELYSYDGMTDYMEGLYPYEEECNYQKAYIENMYRFFGYGMWLVFEKETGKLVGRAGVEHREELEGELELGYAIGIPWQGKGYATEVCEGILKYVRDELGFEEICSLVQPGNEASIHLLEKLDFTLEEELMLDGVPHKKFKKCL